jgi:3D (Asp-Asp-Asp) domain-containing protein
MKASAIPLMLAGLATLLVSACDDGPEGGTVTGSPAPTPSDADLAQGNRIAAAAGQIAPAGESSPFPFGGSMAAAADSAQTGADLSELGGDASANQQAFRQRFGLATPTPDQLASWQSYDARLTAYSNRDADWPYPTAAAPNWEGSTWNGDPSAIEGTTVAVDFSRIPRGSLIYIPALDMYAEANDTGATGLWSTSDSGEPDYSSNGAGRIDVYHWAGGRSSGEVESGFENAIGNREYGTIYVVYRGSGWKRG